MSSCRTIYVRYLSLLQLVKILRNSVSTVNTRMLDDLLNKGINVNEKVTSDCRTPLHLAAAIKCETASVAALKVILQHAANPNIPNEEGNTALHIAASLGHRYALRLLICNGGDLLQCNIEGKTSIDVAYCAGFFNVSSYLSQSLDAENYETSDEPKFTKVLLNRQLMEVSSNCRDSVTLAASCSLCSRGFNIGMSSEAFSGLLTVDTDRSTMGTDRSDLNLTAGTILQTSKSRLSSTKLSSTKLSSTRLSSTNSFMDSSQRKDFQMFLHHLKDCYNNLRPESMQQSLTTREKLDHFEEKEFLKSRTHCSDDSVVTSTFNNLNDYQSRTPTFTNLKENQSRKRSLLSQNLINNQRFRNMNTENQRRNRQDQNSIKSIVHESTNSPGLNSGREFIDVSGRDLFSTTGSTLSQNYGNNLEQFSGSTVGQFSGSTVGQFSGSTVEQFSGSTVGHFSGTTVEQFSGSTVGHLSGSTLDHISGSTLGQFSGSTLGQLSGGSVGHISGSNLGHISGSTLDKTSATTVGQNTNCKLDYSLESFFTALTSSCFSNKCSSSYITIVEEYLYKDENGIELIERIYPPSLNLTGASTSLGSERNKMERSKAFSPAKNGKVSERDSVGTLTESILGLSGEELRKKLKDLGFIAGPINSCTFRVLQRHFQRLRCKGTQQSLNKPIVIRYSRELEYISNDLGINLARYEELDLKMCEPFIAPEELSCWRSGTQKNCFNYLLLDPRITRNLPLRKNSFPLKELFRNFLHAVFYIGKGSRARPYYHLYEAVSQNSRSAKINSKLTKIKDIWNEGLGVISLHIFQNSIPVESWTREASMIAAFGQDNLCNRIQGTFYGPASTWRKKDQRELGSFFLFKAFNLLLFEGERQIRPHDISIPKWMRKD